MFGEERKVLEQSITKEKWLQMIQSGANYLAKHKEAINKLNVFPVPDGDTGTNMNLSMTSGVKEMKKYTINSLKEQINGFTKGLLMGARGNSGVILSQLFRGFSALNLEKDELNIEDFTDALNKGVDIAYKSVTNPVEGTILTVAKDMAKEATKCAKEKGNFISFFEAVVAEAKQSLERTPNLLPVLKEVGVVDSGGKGLVVIYEGFLAGLKGETIEEVDEPSFETQVEIEHEEMQSALSIESIERGYCTEFFIQLDDEKTSQNPFDEATFRTRLTEYGDSLLVASEGDLVKVHIHTEIPGDVLTLAQTYGDLKQIDIENMREQYKDAVQSSLEEDSEELPYAIITVAQGKGLKEVFKSIGATAIIDGGQTMNPSTEDFLHVINQQRAEHIFILPNNKNILLAAEQAVDLTDRQVTVIPTVTIPQGIQALFAFDDGLSFVEVAEEMKEAAVEVKTGLVTYATRDTKINDLVVHKDDFIGLNDETIVVSEKSRITATKALLKDLIDEDDEIVTLFAGEDVTEEELEELEVYIDGTYEDVEVEFHQGDQPIYAYIIMVE